MTPREVTLSYYKKSQVFLKRSKTSILVGAIMAGMLISMGGFATYTSTVDSAAFIGLGFTKILRGLIFSFGLMSIVFSGGDLFTGTLLYVPGTTSKEKLELVKRMGIVLFGNFLGSIFLYFVLSWAGSMSTSFHDTINPVAEAKLALSPFQAVAAGFLCNFLVTLALRTIEASSDFAGKALANALVIAVFIIGGFEHSVANFFTLPAGMGIGVLATAAFYKNIFFVVIGNALGGAFLGYMSNFIYKDL